MSYVNLGVHQIMLQDKIRTASYETAIRNIVRPGDRVLDFGAGTGILSFFAARCGASAVFSVDKSPIIRVAQTVAAANGFDNIAFYHEGGDTVALPEPVDVIVSEWMGSFVFHEWMLSPLLRLRDRYLKADGTMIPSRITLKVGFITDPAVFEDAAYFASRPYGIDFKAIEEWPYYTVSMKRIAAEQVLADVAIVGELDMGRVALPTTPFIGDAPCQNSATVFGLCGWFDAELAEGISLATGPFDPPTHWRQLVFPLSRPMRASAGSVLRVGVTPLRNKGDVTTLWRWYVSNGEETIEMDDFVHRAWMTRPLREGRLP